MQEMYSACRIDSNREPFLASQDLQDRTCVKEESEAAPGTGLAGEEEAEGVIGLCCIIKCC